MSPENRPFDVTPKVVPADQETTVSIRPLLDGVRFREGEEFDVTYAATAGPGGRETFRARAADEVLKITRRFVGEQEHVIDVARVGGGCSLRDDVRLYSLRDDLFARLPYKGDMHMHSCRSDGVEPPAYVAAACRRIGLDFMAVTDHGAYAPSLEAREMFRGVAADLRIYPGEEVHPPDNPTHIINFGGRFSINELFAQQSYQEAVEAMAAALPELPANVDRRQYASSRWVFDKIREARGLGIFCHPDWFADHHYQLPQPLAAYLLEQRPFDAYELIGGYARSEAFSNNRQVARYADERARGGTLPIVGVSDAHGCETGELFGWYYTVAFSPSLDLPDLIRSIKEEYSVAVEALPGEAVRVYGPLRLVGYTHYLLREAFPQHDLLCAQEGQLMLDFVAGKPGAADELSRRHGSAARLSARYWAREDG